MKTLRARIHPNAFTLIEVLIVVVVLVILVGIALPSYFRSVERTRAAEALVNLSTIRTAQLAHQAQHGAFVEALDLPTINDTLDLELSARYFDYEIAQADETSFLIVATSRRSQGSGTSPLRITMDQAGRITWPIGGGSGGGGIGGAGVGGGVTGGGGGGGGTSGGGGGGSSGGVGGRRDSRRRLFWWIRQPGRHCAPTVAAGDHFRARHLHVYRAGAGSVDRLACCQQEEYHRHAGSRLSLGRV